MTLTIYTSSAHFDASPGILVDGADAVHVVVVSGSHGCGGRLLEHGDSMCDIKALFLSHLQLKTDLCIKGLQIAEINKVEDHWITLV